MLEIEKMMMRIEVGLGGRVGWVVEKSAPTVGSSRGSLAAHELVGCVGGVDPGNGGGGHRSLW
jgi:hypothetical protein